MLQTKTLTTIAETNCYFEKVMSSSSKSTGNGRSFLYQRSSRSSSSQPLPDSVVAQAGDVDTLRPETVENVENNYADYDDSFLDENDNPFADDDDDENNISGDENDDGIEVKGEGFTEKKANNNLSTILTNTYTFKREEIIWKNVFLIGAIHLIAAYSLYAFIIGTVKWQNMLICFAFGAISAFGITVGAHRLWAHRSFKAKWPLRLV